MHAWAIPAVSVVFSSISSGAADESKPTGSLPPRPPNILMAIADDWSVHAGAYGTAWVKTPNFDRVARDGILFSHAYTPVAKCAPSRASLLTGRNPWLLKEAANHHCYFPAEFKTFPEALVEQGWRVGYTCKGWAPGVARNAQGKNRKMTGQPFARAKARPPASGMSDNDYAANFDAFLDGAAPDKPWCFWYGSVEPHRDYEAGSGTRAGKRNDAIDHVPGYWPDNETVRSDMLDYALEVEHFDRHLGRMLESLEKRGMLDNTLVIVTSDHGMPFPRVKGGTYDFANRVPFAVMWKNGIVRPGRRCDQFISFPDIAPTLFQVAGIPWESTGLAAPSGHSVADILKDEAAPFDRASVLIGKERTDVGRPGDVGYPTRGIVRGDWLFLRNYKPDRWPMGNPETGYGDTDDSPTKRVITQADSNHPEDRSWGYCFGMRPATELYNLREDPDCLINLAGANRHEETRTQLEAEMTGRLTEQQDPRMLGQGDLFDRYLYATPSRRGAYERYLEAKEKADQTR